MSKSTSSAMAAAVHLPKASNNDSAPQSEHVFRPENGAKIIIVMNRKSSDDFGFNLNALNSEIIVSLSGPLENVLKRVDQGLRLYNGDGQECDPVVVIKGSHGDWTTRTVNLNDTSVKGIVEHIRQTLIKSKNSPAFSFANPAP